MKRQGGVWRDGRLLRINSHDATPGSVDRTGAAFSVNLGNTLRDFGFSVTGFSLESCGFYNLQRVVTRNKTDRVSIGVNGVYQDVVIEQGNYTIERLLDTLNAELAIVWPDLKFEQGGDRLTLVTILRDVCEFYEPLAAEKEQSVAVQLPVSCPGVFDRDLLFQAFANLLDNAIKYTPDHGRVTIAVKCQPDRAVVEFHDTGIGISPDEQDKIWTRLYRSDKSRSQRGLGLGLSLVKAIVEAQGGEVKVASELNKGSVFSVVLPR